jgi:hypothetical protein
MTQHLNRVYDSSVTHTGMCDSSLTHTRMRSQGPIPSLVHKDFMVTYHLWFFPLLSVNFHQCQDLGHCYIQPFVIFDPLL